MNSRYKDKLVGVYAPGNYGHTSVLDQTQREITKGDDGTMRYKVIVYYDDMEDSEHVFSNKNDAINELHRLRGVKYRNARKYKVEMVECDG